VAADLVESRLVEAVRSALARGVRGPVGLQQRGGQGGGPQLAVGIGVGDRPQVTQQVRIMPISA
jgi:hypothetical protein